MHNPRCGCVFAQERNMPQRVNANAALSWGASWADHSLHLAWLQSFPSSTPQAHLAASTFTHRKPSWPYVSSALQLWIQVSSIQWDSCILPLDRSCWPLVPARLLRSVLLVQSGPSASSQAILGCSSRAQQLFLQEESRQKPWQWERWRHGQSALWLGMVWLLMLSLQQCSWGFIHWKYHSREPLMLLFPSTTKCSSSRKAAQSLDHCSWGTKLLWYKVGRAA